MEYSSYYTEWWSNGDKRITQIWRSQSRMNNLCYSGQDGTRSSPHMGPASPWWVELHQDRSAHLGNQNIPHLIWRTHAWWDSHHWCWLPHTDLSPVQSSVCLTGKLLAADLPSLHIETELGVLVAQWPYHTMLAKWDIINAELAKMLSVRVIQPRNLYGPAPLPLSPRTEMTHFCR